MKVDTFIRLERGEGRDKESVFSIFIREHHEVADTVSLNAKRFIVTSFRSFSDAQPSDFKILARCLSYHLKLRV